MKPIFNISFVHRLLLLGMLLLIGTSSIAQQASEKEKQGVESSPIREEIQRYIGYEDLLPRYISLPYDVTMNTNIASEYVDISFLLLLLLPILFLMGNKGRPWLNIAAIISLFFMLIIAIPTGYSNKKDIAVEEVGVHMQNYLENTSFADAPTRVIVVNIYQVFNSLYQPFDALFNVITGQSDYVTYPLLILLFLGILYLVNTRIEHRSLVTKSTINVLAIFSLLWFVLSAGIAWYGLLMITLGLMFTIVGWVGKDRGFFPSYHMKYYTFLSIVAFWVLMAFTYRASNFNPSNEATAKSMLFPIVLQYAGNQKTEKDLLESVFPQFDLAIKQMNSEDESLILRIGTFLPFFIEKNDRRIVTDNQLGFFDALDKRFSDKNELAQAMKASGFRYIIVDLKTPDIDQTPEQTLRKKFTNLVKFIDRNPSLKFIATDNIILDEQGNNVYSISGAKIIRRGNFAVFEII